MIRRALISFNRKLNRYSRYIVKKSLMHVPFFLLSPKSRRLRPNINLAVNHLVLVGPANFAGQAHQWSKAITKHGKNIHAVSQSVDRGGISFPADYQLGISTYRNHQWGKSHLAWIKKNFDWVLIDGMRPLLGPLYGEDCIQEVDVFLSSGINVGLIAHGSDIRIPSVHADLYANSPFRNVPRDKRDWVAQLERQSTRWNHFFNDFEGPTFISTLDLLDFAPAAKWLPVVEDIDLWKNGENISKESSLRVLHVPSNGYLKGSDEIDLILNSLHDDGVIEYVRAENIPFEKMPNLIKSVDLVVDQIVLGTAVTGTAVQALASGKIVVAHVQGKAKSILQEISCPIIFADKTSLRETILNVASNPNLVRDMSAEGVKYAARFHDGKVSAKAIIDDLNLDKG